MLASIQRSVLRPEHGPCLLGGQAGQGKVEEVLCRSHCCGPLHRVTPQTLSLKVNLALSTGVTGACDSLPRS